jgi:poly(3-hydroxybutyrate) depolymerase
MRIAVAVLFMFMTSPLFAAKAYDKTADIQGMTLHYKVVLPRDYDPAKTYPAILAFPPGSQTMDMVLTTLTQNWLPEADRHGFIVVVPAAPNGLPFTGAGARVFPEFLDRLVHEYKVRDNKFHIAGMSNGGRSAFHIAAMYPQYFKSITGLPGYLPNPTPERIAALENMCIYMHVGEFDDDWVQEMQEQASMLQAKGYRVRFTVEKNEGHVMRSLAFDNSGRLYKEIEEARDGCAREKKNR